MPFKSRQQEKWAFATKQPFAKKWADITNQKSLPNKKKIKPKLKVNNKLKGALGSSEFKKGNIPTGKIQINVKKHKGDKAELASTIKHEMYHVKHPKATEKQTYKATAKTKIPPAEQTKLLAKLRMKSLNYKEGAIKRKFKMGKVSSKPGDLITRMNESKKKIIKSKSNNLSKQQVAIRGLV